MKKEQERGYFSSSHNPPKGVYKYDTEKTKSGNDMQRREL